MTTFELNHMHYALDAGDSTYVQSAKFFPTKENCAEWIWENRKQIENKLGQSDGFELCRFVDNELDIFPNNRKKCIAFSYYDYVSKMKVVENSTNPIEAILKLLEEDPILVTRLSRKTKKKV